jgi:uncharacterized protein (TIGR02466 family)
MYSHGMQGLQLWPSILFFQLWPNYSEYRAILTHGIRELKAKQNVPIESRIALGAKPNRGLYESHFDLFSLEVPGLPNLVQFIETSLKQAVCLAHSKAFRSDSVQIRFVDSWYHITTDGGYHDAHWHHGCSWCGIFYLDLGDYSPKGPSAPNGGSRFYCPIVQGGAYKDAGNQYVHPFYDPPLENGLLILFPSHLLHSGLPYQGIRERIVLAFNAQVLGGLSGQ